MQRLTLMGGRDAMSFDDGENGFRAGREGERGSHVVQMRVSCDDHGSDYSGGELITTVHRGKKGLVYYFARQRTADGHPERTQIRISWRVYLCLVKNEPMDRKRFGVRQRQSQV